MTSNLKRKDIGFAKRPSDRTCVCGHDIFNHSKTSFIFFWLLNKGKCSICMCDKFISEVEAIKQE